MEKPQPHLPELDETNHTLRDAARKSRRERQAHNPQETIPGLGERVHEFTQALKHLSVETKNLYDPEFYRDKTVEEIRAYVLDNFLPKIQPNTPDATYLQDLAQDLALLIATAVGECREISQAESKTQQYQRIADRLQTYSQLSSWADAASPSELLGELGPEVIDRGALIEVVFASRQDLARWLFARDPLREAPEALSVRAGALTVNFMHQSTPDQVRRHEERHAIHWIAYQCHNKELWQNEYGPNWEFVIYDEVLASSEHVQSFEELKGIFSGTRQDGSYVYFPALDEQRRSAILEPALSVMQAFWPLSEDERNLVIFFDIYEWPAIIRAFRYVRQRSEGVI